MGGNDMTWVDPGAVVPAAVDWAARSELIAEELAGDLAALERFNEEQLGSGETRQAFEEVYLDPTMSARDTIETVHGLGPSMRDLAANAGTAALTTASADEEVAGLFGCGP